MRRECRNALDAGASSIDIFLSGEDGLDYFYLRDNGEGIPRASLADSTKRYYTSKLGSYEELLELTTYGFRGEALNSLCSVSARVIISTKTELDEWPILAEFNTHGELIHSEELNDRNPKYRTHFVEGSTSGTEVRVEGLFKNFPVRLQQQRAKLKKNIRSVGPGISSV